MGLRRFTVAIMNRVIFWLVIIPAVIIVCAIFGSVAVTLTMGR